MIAETFDLGPGVATVVGILVTGILTLLGKNVVDARQARAAATETKSVAAETKDAAEGTKTLATEMREILSELKQTLTQNNGGSSVKDALDEIRRGQAAVHRRLDDHDMILAELRTVHRLTSPTPLPPPPAPPARRRSVIVPASEYFGRPPADTPTTHTNPQEG